MITTLLWFFLLLTDRYVLIGNHRDAWGYGAADPSSGTAALLESARVLGEMLKKGKVSVQFCLNGK